MFPESGMRWFGQGNLIVQTTWWGHVFTNTGSAESVYKIGVNCLTPVAPFTNMV